MGPLSIVGLGIALLVGVVLLTFAMMRGSDERRVQHIRRKLAAAARDGGVFSEDSITDLPEPARRYLRRAIAPGAPLYSLAHLAMSGQFRMRADSPWRPMTARQTLAPPSGFVWRGKVGNGIWFEGGDDYWQGQGRLRVWLWGIFPIVRAGGPDVARSQIGRLAGESVLVPSALLPQNGASWAGVDKEFVIARVRIDAEEVDLTLRIDPEGRLEEVTFPRWGDPDDSGVHRYVPFGVRITGELSLEGYRLPAGLAAGWWYGTERHFEFFRASIEAIEFG